MALTASEFLRLKIEAAQTPVGRVGRPSGDPSRVLVKSRRPCLSTVHYLR